MILFLTILLVTNSLHLYNLIFHLDIRVLFDFCSNFDSNTPVDVGGEFFDINKAFDNSINNTLNPMCLWWADVETTEHFPLHFHCFSTQRTELYNNLYSLDLSFSKLNTKDKVACL